MSKSVSGDRVDVSTAPEVESVCIRNYDTDRPHRIRLAVTDDDGSVFEASYRLRPGEVRSQVGVVSAGAYDVEVVVDGEHRDVGRCRVGEASGRTILVETGNGAVSVSQGIY